MAPYRRQHNNLCPWKHIDTSTWKIIKEAKLKDLKVKNFLFQAIDREIIETILNKGTSKEIWSSMQRKYRGSTRVKRAQLQALEREFEFLNMKEEETIDNYLSRLLHLLSIMKSNGEVIEESMVVSKILNTLILKFNYLVCLIEESNDLGTLTIDELHANLLVHEQHMQVSKQKNKF